MNCSEIETAYFKPRCSLSYKAKSFNTMIYHPALVSAVFGSHNNSSGNSLFEQRQSDRLLALGTSPVPFHKQTNKNACHQCIHQSTKSVCRGSCHQSPSLLVIASLALTNAGLFLCLSKVL